MNLLQYFLNFAFHFDNNLNLLIYVYPDHPDYHRGLLYPNCSAPFLSLGHDSTGELNTGESACWAAIPDHRRLAGCKQQQCISHSSRGWHVQDQNTSRFCVWFPGSQTTVFSLCPPMAEGVRDPLGPLL